MYAENICIKTTLQKVLTKDDKNLSNSLFKMCAGKKKRAVADRSYADGLVHTITASTSLIVTAKLDKRSSSSGKGT